MNKRPSKGEALGSAEASKAQAHICRQMRFERR
eukprot:CAMPEP_0115124356 /NCGR_PEP_ID=MMETSP0227-20121206/48256_1 /TAXON_ID=89957 /ORGANISM="Polarella glacialis, Strain CCMP 1383" /LENGTH=32 /DNA_ID= /DNA_START= /DNA_END= /DNA_ORIENTATION=